MKKSNTLTIGGYQVKVQRKRMKNMYLRLGEEGTLRVSAPLAVSDQQIAAFVLGQEAWIQTAIANKAQAATKPKKRESLSLWGISYPLIVTLGTGKFTFDKECFYITLPETAYQQYEKTGDIEKYVRDFYRWALEQVLPTLWDQALARTKEENVILRMKWMKTRWGTCNPQARRVWLSPRLAQYPKECLYCVIIHELCHLTQPHHDKPFYALMDQCLPNWRESHKLLGERLGDAVP